MAGERQQSFGSNAVAELTSVRNSLLIIAQTGSLDEVPVVRHGLERLSSYARQAGHPRVETLVSRCRAMVSALGNGGSVPARACKTLDIVAAIEAQLLAVPVGINGFLDDVSEFIDSSFASLTPDQLPEDAPATETETFEIDEETIEIFRSESEDLLTNIEDALARLSENTSDQKTLWDIRRNAHTLKGAAGIVGLTDAARIAHRMEDLLDRLVEARRDADPQVIMFLRTSVQALADLCHSLPPHDDGALDDQYVSAMAAVACDKPATGDVFAPAELDHDETAARTDAPRPAAGPIVRVSLDRLDELLKLAGRLALTGAELDEKITGALLNGPGLQPDKALDSFVATARRLAAEIQEGLVRIRMVRFGTLETRLARAIHVTCLDEGKKAAIDIIGADVEIDTQIIDALIEPLLHLLKNAVVHGIERPETRRLIGKPEVGKIRVSIEADDAAFVLAVTDDGQGISLPKLKEKALANGLIDRAAAAQMSDREAIKLIFDRGLTTAEKLDLNAGRGLGMSIVKESVEARGGTVIVESRPHAGTTFTILMPMALLTARPDAAAERATKKPLILIVDDSSVVRRQMQRLVEKAGSTVITAENGADALELLLNGVHEPDLIISDIEMPQIDGWAFLEYVKTDENFGHIPVVVMTSLSGDEHRSRAFELGAADYIVKPFNAKNLERIFAAAGGIRT